MKPPLLFLLFFSIAHCVTAQSFWSGKIIDKETKQPVSSATVLNTFRNHATLTDKTGRFSLPANSGDSIKISSMGYKKMLLVVTDANDKIELLLTPDVLQLNEVVVKGLNEAQFKKEFMEASAPEKIPINASLVPMGIPLGNFGRMGYDFNDFSPKLTTKGPISLVYDAFNKEARTTRKVARLEKFEAKRRAYRLRMDTTWISRITDLKGDRLDSFMKFCQLPEDFVLSADDYELTVAIKTCLKDFLAMNN